jgi:hypothetical protein
MTGNKCLYLQINITLHQFVVDLHAALLAQTAQQLLVLLLVLLAGRQSRCNLPTSACHSMPAASSSLDKLMLEIRQVAINTALPVMTKSAICHDIDKWCQQLPAAELAASTWPLFY